MLFLLFQIGQDRYALEAGKVVEILPMVALKKIPGAPLAAAGICDYHGALVPVIDLSQLVQGESSPPRLSTRLLLVNYPVAPGHTEILGLMVERATETVQFDPAKFEETSIAVPEIPCLGPVARDAYGLIQLIRIDEVLPESLRARLFPRLEKAA